MKIKHIFTDMDGTLLDSHGSVSDTNHWSIYYSDLPITLVSAQSLGNEQYCRKITTQNPQIAFNGNLTFTQNQFGLQIIDKNPLASETVSQLLNYISTEFPNVSLNWYSLAHWYINKQDKGTFIQKAITGIEPKIKTFDGQSEIYKIMMIVFDSQELLQLQAQLNNLNIPNISVQQSGQWYLEITSDNKTKPTLYNQYLIIKIQTFRKLPLLVMVIMIFHFSNQLDSLSPQIMLTPRSKNMLKWLQQKILNMESLKQYQLLIPLTNR